MKKALNKPGSERRVFQAGPLTFGVVICHEGWRYPETARWLLLSFVSAIMGLAWFLPANRRILYRATRNSSGLVEQHFPFSDKASCAKF